MAHGTIPPSGVIGKTLTLGQGCEHGGRWGCQIQLSTNVWKFLTKMVGIQFWGSMYEMKEKTTV